MLPCHYALSYIICTLLIHLPSSQVAVSLARCSLADGAVFRACRAVRAVGQLTGTSARQSRRRLAGARTHGRRGGDVAQLTAAEQHTQGAENGDVVLHVAVVLVVV